METKGAVDLCPEVQRSSLIHAGSLQPPTMQLIEPVLMR